MAAFSLAVLMAEEPAHAPLGHFRLKRKLAGRLLTQSRCRERSPPRLRQTVANTGAEDEDEAGGGVSDVRCHHDDARRPEMDATRDFDAPLMLLRNRNTRRPWPAHGACQITPRGGVRAGPYSLVQLVPVGPYLDL